MTSPPENLTAQGELADRGDDDAFPHPVGSRMISPWPAWTKLRLAKGALFDDALMAPSLLALQRGVRSRERSGPAAGGCAIRRRAAERRAATNAIDRCRPGEPHGTGGLAWHGARR